MKKNDGIESTICDRINCPNFEERLGGHYNHLYIKTEYAMEALQKVFSHGKADEMNFVLFSTSGVHGCYTTIEKVEERPLEYGNTVTFVIIHPRLATIKYGNVQIESKKDIRFIKKLRKSSWKAVLTIGRNYKPNIVKRIFRWVCSKRGGR